MSDPHATDAPGHAASAGVDHHDPADHGDAALGPIDAAAWGAGVMGVAIAVVIAACFALATAAPA